MVKDKHERLLLMLCMIDAILLVLTCARFPIYSPLVGTMLGDVLTTETYISAFENLLAGFIAAYFFYLLNGYFPRQRVKREKLRLLNSCVASILDSYKREKIWGHETALPFVDTGCLDQEWLKKQVVDLRRAKTSALKLKFTLDTAYTREGDFKNLLQIASQVSPEHAEQWLVIIDKVRLLSENYGNQPKVTDEQMHLVLKRSKDSPMHDYHVTLEFRIMEFIEASIKWLELR